MIKLQGKCKLVLAFVAAAAMLGTACAANEVSYENGGTIDLTAIKDNAVYKPDTNGAITVNISGDLGSKGAEDTKSFKIYGAKDNADGSTNFTVNWGKSKLYTKGIVQIIAGGISADLKDSSLTFDSEAGSDIYTGSGSGQETILLAAGPEGGSVSGNTTLNIDGKLGTDDAVYYLKATAGGLLNNDSSSDSIVVEGDSIVNFNADWKTGKDRETALLAGPMIQKDDVNSKGAEGIVKGATIVTVNGGGSVREIWAAGALLNKGTPSLTVGSAEVRILKGAVDDTVFAGAEVYANGTATVLGDASITFSGGTMGGNGERARLFGGHYVEADGGKGYIDGSTYIKITGGSGIKYVFGGGMAWTKTTASGRQSVVRGNSNVSIVGDAGLSALDENAMIFAGGRRTTGQEEGTIAVVNGDGIVTFKNITKAYKGTISGQGTGSAYTVTEYTDSVSGDSVLVFDNVQADFSGATIVEMDRIELSSGTKLKLADLGGATAIKLTGNWTNLGTPLALTLTKAVEQDVTVDYSEATGVVSAAFNEAKTELVVTCKNAPIAVTPTALKLQLGKSDTVKAATPVVGETVTWKSSDTAVAAVDDAGKVTAHKAGIAVISATGSVTKTTAGCTVTVEDPAAPDPVPTPAPVTPTVITEKDNPVTKDKDVPADVKPATPVIKPATEENTKALAASADVPVKFFTATADGNITVDPVIAKKTVASVMSDDAAVAPKTIVTLPIITATISDGKVAALAMKTTGAQLGAAANNIVSDITLIKILKDETGAKFGYTAEPAGYADQSFTLKNADGNNLAFTDKIDPAATYTLILFVKDNGEFDYDKTMGSVIDPMAMAMNEAKAPKPSGGSSSGCSAGVGVLALLALLPLAAARRRK
ncbi:Ig-like domain-containing protein [Cloacibacillus porcorum]